MDLTPKQEKFVQGLVEGKSQREAYKQAYSCNNMKDSAIDSNAYKLMQNTQILLRYEELVAEFKDKALYTREQANTDYEWIKLVAKEDIQVKGLKQANSSAYLNAVKGQCDLNDLWPTKDKVDSKTQEEEISKVLKEALEGI